MLPIQFIFLLLIVTMPGQLVQASGDGNPHPLPTLHTMPAWVAYAALIVNQVLVVAFTFWLGRKTIRQLHEPSTATTPVITRMEILFSRARWTTCALTAMYLFLTPLASELVGWSENTRFLKYFLLPEFLFLAPAVLAWVAMWSVAYFVETAIRERSLPFALARGQPVHEMPGMGAFLALQMRHNFYPFLFLLFQGAVRSLAAGLWALIQHWNRNLDKEGTWSDGIATVAALLSFFLVLPSLLMAIWPTTPLTGPLRQRLDAVAARYGLRFRQILLWRSQNTMINAAIIGWVARGRYFLMSDALVESFPDPQLESVFAHEVGHGVHRHLHWLIAGVFSVLGLAGGIAGIVAKLVTTNEATGQMIGLIVATALLCVLVALLIWMVSPQFEHQADWFACRHMAQTLREGGQEPAVESSRPEGPPVLVTSLGAMAGPMAMLTSGGSSMGPSEMLAALPPEPTAAEAITKDAYLAGHYPHATPAPTAHPTEPSRAADGTTAAPHPMIPELAGTEIFVAALESIADSLHRERTRRGWFHPSIARRVELVRQLAVDPSAEARFDAMMRRTRYGILALAICALVTMGISQFIPNRPQPTNSSGNSAPTAATH